jgi:hypothetical protein
MILDLFRFPFEPGRVSRSGLALWLTISCLLMAGCDREKIQTLEAENAELRAELAITQKKLTEGANTSVAENVTLDLTLKDLWSQRFEDTTEFRARQRLSQKEIRVTGLVESVDERSVKLFDTGARYGAVSLVAQVDDNFLSQNAEGLAALKKGTLVTVQGRFAFDKMRLEGAVFVDRKTGKLLSSKDLVSLSGADGGEPPKNEGLNEHEQANN